MPLSSGALLRLLIRLNLKEFNGNLHLYVTLDFNDVCNYSYEDILLTSNFLTLQLRRRHRDALFIINVLKTKLVAHLFRILLVRVYPLGLSETYSTFTVHSNFKVSQPDVFLLPM
jgi:hypothetical protein